MKRVYPPRHPAWLDAKGEATAPAAAPEADERPAAGSPGANAAGAGRARARKREEVAGGGPDRPADKP